jgi:hypothetical protein
MALITEKACILVSKVGALFKQRHFFRKFHRIRRLHSFMGVWVVSIFHEGQVIVASQGNMSFPIVSKGVAIEILLQ